MTSKSSISKAKTKAKNEYATTLIKDFKKIQDGSLKSISIDLNAIKTDEAVRLIQQNISNHRLFFQLEGGKYYALTEYTMDKLSKGLIDDNRLAGDNKGSDEELRKVSSYTNIITLQTLEEKIKEEKSTEESNIKQFIETNKRMNKKTKPQGSFFKYYHKTHFDLTEYGIYKSTDKADYDNNCFYFNPSFSQFFHQFLIKIIYFFKFLFKFIIIKSL